MTHRLIRRSLQVLTGILLGLTIVWFWAPKISDGPASPESYFLPSPLPAPDFTLTSHTGEEVSSQDFSEKIRVVFFGYTYCPDVCPLTLTHLSQAFRLMEEEGESIQVLLISVDPARDTPERLAGYLSNFHPSFLGLTGTEEKIRGAADGFGAYFSKVGEGDGYTVDHTARTFVLNHQDQIVLTFPITATPGEMARDLEALLARETG